MVTEYGPGLKELHDTVAVPELSTLEGAIAEHVNPGAILSVRVTVPVNPFTADIETVIVADAPGLTAGGGLTGVGKSVTMKSGVAEWGNDPLNPVTVTT